MAEKPINIAIIGLGHIGSYHVEAIKQIDLLNLVAVCDRLVKYKSITPKDVDYYQDYKQLLRDKTIDTVIVATPNTTHLSICLDVLSTGKHLIVEKPAVTAIEDLYRLEKTAHKKDCSIYYALHAARAIDVSWTVNYMNSKKIRREFGPVTGFSANFYDPYIKNGNLLLKADGLQNCWLDSGINALSVLQRFFKIDDLNIENISPALNFNRKPEILQCNVQYSFSISGKDQNGFGVIDTNWTNSRNHKSTKLFFGETRNMLNMDHSAQKVYRSFPDGRYLELADLTYGNERLYNHYIEVFKDYLGFKMKKKLNLMMNNDAAISIHEQLFKIQTDIDKILNSN